MQMVQFLSTLQEAPRVFSDVISVACTTHSWGIFCCFCGRILGGTASVGVGVTHLISLRILLFFWRHIRWLYISFDPQFILLKSLVTSCQLPYHIEIRYFSKPTVIRADSPHLKVKQTATLLFSNEIWVILCEYVHSKNNRYSVVNSM